MTETEVKKEEDKYPFYPKPAAPLHDGLKYLQDHRLAVDIDEVNGQQVVIVSKKQ